MISVHCTTCGAELEEPGGLVFGPPDEVGFCKKLHLCRSCFELLFIGPFRNARPIDDTGERAPVVRHPAWARPVEDTNDL